MIKKWEVAPSPVDKNKDRHKLMIKGEMKDIFFIVKKLGSVCSRPEKSSGEFDFTIYLSKLETDTMSKLKEVVAELEKEDTTRRSSAPARTFNPQAAAQTAPPSTAPAQQAPAPAPVPPQQAAPAPAPAPSPQAAPPPQPAAPPPAAAPAPAPVTPPTQPPADKPKIPAPFGPPPTVSGRIKQP
ncbi:MAG: hypothetical protein RQ748_09140, partial [Elusimicrobiales bacterium]|nr:hypothetical protein [Elusimicrobiales bacterium]